MSEQLNNPSDPTAPKRIVIIGGYGVFGGRLAKALIAEKKFNVIVAGRDGDKARDFCINHGGRPAVLNASGRSIYGAIEELAPFAVIDAAGPFQVYERQKYGVARAAIECGAHYLDLSDDASFTKGITMLDEAARTAGVAVLSGVSSVPALSSAAVEELRDGLTDIHLIESAILPGNRAPRGVSVMRAILEQVGQDIPVQWDGAQKMVTGWSDRRTLTLTTKQGRPLKNRWASFIGAPDLALFPDHFNARTVLFRAGLELKFMHGGLSVLSRLVRIGLLPNLGFSTNALRVAAMGLIPFGSDRGGMITKVVGLTPEGSAEERRWTLIVKGGRGPEVPTIPVQIMIEKLINDGIAPGARPALGVFSLAEAEKALTRLNAQMSVERQILPMVFPAILGTEFYTAPPEIVDLHTAPVIRVWRGEARITRGDNFFARLAGAIAGFAPAGQNVPVTVEMRREEKKSVPSETWTRRFGGKTFRSYLRPGKRRGRTVLIERFGLLQFAIQLRLEDGRLKYPVVAGSCCSIPLPQWLLPISRTKEFVDDEGRACFDVVIDMPIGGRVASYKGWLKPAGDLAQ